MRSTKILGIRIDIIGKREAVDKIIELSKGRVVSYVSTVNPEYVVSAQSRPWFKEFLNKSSLSLCDGTGILLASRLFPPAVKERVRGSDILSPLLKEAKKNNLSVQVVLYKDSLSTAEQIKRYCMQKLGLSVRVVSSPDEGADLYIYTHPYLVSNKLIMEKADKWHKGVFLNVGGSFDTALKVRKPCPRIFRVLGLEWLYRLLQEPIYMHKRIYRAVFVFTILVLKEKTVKTFKKLFARSIV